MQRKMSHPTQEDYLQRRKVLEEGFASGIFACYQLDTERMKRLQEHRQVMPLPTSEQELYARELAWKEIEIDIAVAKKEAFKRAHSDQQLPAGLTQKWITNTEPRLSKSDIEEIRPQFANTGMLQPDTTIQVLYDPRTYNPRVSLGSTRPWQTVDFLWLSKDLQKEAAARLEKFLGSRNPDWRVTYNQETYLRQAIKPRAFLQLWDHAALVMHHWLKAWIFIYRRTNDTSNLVAAKKLYDEFIAREPIEEWHMACMERFWMQGMAEQADSESWNKQVSRNSVTRMRISRPAYGWANMVTDLGY